MKAARIPVVPEWPGHRARLVAMATAYLHYIVNTANGRIEGVAIHSEESSTRLSSHMFVEGGWPSRATAETYHDAHLRLRNMLIEGRVGGWQPGSPVRVALVALGLTGVQQSVRWPGQDPDGASEPVTRSWIANGCLVEEHPAEVREYGIKARSKGFPSWTVTALDAVMRPAEQSKTTWRRKPVTHVWAYSTCPAQTAVLTRDGFRTGTPLLSYRNGCRWLTPVSKVIALPAESTLYSARQAMVEAGVPNAEMGGSVSTADAIRYLAKQRDEALAERDAARKEHAYLLMRIREWAK